MACMSEYLLSTPVVYGGGGVEWSALILFHAHMTVVGMHQAWTYHSHDFLAVDNLLGREPRARAVKRSEQSSI